MGPRDIRSATWYLNRVSFRTWDHFPVITKIEGRELKAKKRIKDWAGWVPVSETEKAKFKELVLCPRSDHGEGDPRETEEGNGMAFLHDRLVPQRRSRGWMWLGYATLWRHGIYWQRGSGHMAVQDTTDRDHFSQMMSGSLLSSLCSILPGT